MESNPISYIDTQMQYYLGINPQDLTDEEWGEKYAQLEDIRKKENEH